MTDTATKQEHPGAIDRAMRALVAELASRPGGVTKTELAKLTGKAMVTAAAYLYRMEKAGQLFKRFGNIGGRVSSVFWTSQALADAHVFAVSPYTGRTAARGRGEQGATMGAAERAIQAGCRYHADIAQAIGNDSRESVVRACGELTRLGRVFRAPDLDKRNHMQFRYFATAAERDAWVADPANDLAARRKASQEKRDEKRRERQRLAYQTAPKVVRVKAPRERKPGGRHNHDRAMAEILARQRKREEAEANKPALLAGEPDMSRAKVTVLPPMRDRWAVEIPAQGGAFSSLRPGQYAFEANTCAARAAA